MATKQKPIHKTRMRVPWFDVDRENIVYFGNYFRFFTIAEDDFLRSHGITHNTLRNEFGIGLTRISVECHYKRPASYDDLIEIEITAILESDIFLTFMFRIFREDEHALLAEGKVRTACVRLENGLKLTRMPDQVFNKLKHIVEEPLCMTS